LIAAEHHLADELVNGFTSQRQSFYVVQYVPHVFIDGKYNQIGASSCTGAAAVYRGFVNQRLAETGGLSPVSITGSYWIQGTTLTLSAVFSKVDAGDLVDARAYLALTEDGVLSGGVTYNHVTRGGLFQNVTLTNVGDQVLVQGNVALNTAWIQANFKGVAWLQKTSGDKEIYQAAILPLDASDVADGTPAAREMRLLRVSPNPVAFGPAGGGEVTLRLAPEGEVRGAVQLDVLDSGGRVVYHMDAHQAALGPVTLAWDGRDAGGRTMESGAYWIRLTSSVGVHQGRVLVIR
jgi:hypothetical protein